MLLLDVGGVMTELQQQQQRKKTKKMRDGERKVVYKTDAPVNGLVQVLMTEIDIIDVQMKIGYTLLLFYKNNNNNNNTSGCIFFTHIL